MSRKSKNKIPLKAQQICTPSTSGSRNFLKKSTNDTAPPQCKPQWGWGLLLIFTVLIAYLPVWHAGFIWDDDTHLTKNPCIIGPLGFKAIWTTSAAVYYPLVLTTFWLLHALWGLNPLPYHLVNVAMHAACAVTLWRVLVKLQVRGAWLGAALWALHPVMVESVAWITELKNTQSCLFYLLSISCFLNAQADEPGKRPNWRQHGMALLFFVMAITSKTSTVMLPVVLALCIWWREGGWRWRNAVRLSPFFLISALAGAWTIWEQKFHSRALGVEWTQSWPQRIIIAGRDIWFYLGKLAWPHPLAFIYPRWEINASHPAEYLPVLAAAGALFVFWRYRNAGTRPLFFAAAYFAVSLFPVLDFFDVYFFRYSFAADHFQYLAAMGPLALLAAAITKALESFEMENTLLKYALYGILLIAPGIPAFFQAANYSGSETIWRDTLAKNPGCWMAWSNLGVILVHSDRSGEAIACFQKALAIKPNLAETHNDFGLALLYAGRVQDAITHYKRALELKPDYAEAQYNLALAFSSENLPDDAIAHYQAALDLHLDLPQVHNDFGLALMREGRLQEAIAHFHTALEREPGYAEAHYNLALALLQKGSGDDAIAQFRKAIDARPDYAEAHNDLGTALLQKGRTSDAIDHYQKAVDINPAFAEARNNLANALAQQGRTDDAIAQYQKAIEFNPGILEAHYNLANALVQKGKTEEAIIQFQKTLDINPYFAEAHDGLGAILAQKGRADEAIIHFRKALEINPGFADAHSKLGVALFHKDQWKEAIDESQKAVTIDPENPESQTNLAYALATCPQASFRNGAKAVELAELANKSTHGSDPNVLVALAAAYAETGRFDLAVETAQRALELANAQSDTALADQLRSQIMHYQAKTPFRDSGSGQ